MNIGTNLKILMERHRLNLAELAKKTGIAKQTLHNWLNGAEPKSIGQVKTLATFFDISIEELCFGEKTKKSSKLTIQDYEHEINAGIFEVVLRRVKK